MVFSIYFAELEAGVTTVILGHSREAKPEIFKHSSIELTRTLSSTQAGSVPLFDIGESVSCSR